MKTVIVITGSVKNDGDEDISDGINSSEAPDQDQDGSDYDSAESFDHDELIDKTEPFDDMVRRPIELIEGMEVLSTTGNMSFATFNKAFKDHALSGQLRTFFRDSKGDVW